MSAPGCQLCGCGPLRDVPGYADLPRVTSDCRPWPAGGTLTVCDHCGGVQHRLDEDWRDQTRRIYEQYNIYYQSGGVEQAVFTPGGGAGISRSTELVRRLCAETDLPAQGRMLDVGCGNGATLRAFSQFRPGWKLVGTELSDRHKAAVEKLPGVELMHAGPIENLPGVFNLGTLVHVLEHVEQPAELLRALRHRLAPGGALLTQVPDHRANPFDLLIADHCWHFTAATLTVLLQRHGLTVVTAANWISRELTVLARSAAESPARPRAGVITNGAISAAHQRVAWLRSLPDWAGGFPVGVGLFGTSIAATWMHSVLGQRVAFFVDEDPSRVGRTYHDRPVYRPGDVPRGSDVLVLLPPEQSGPIAARLSRPGVTYHPTPPLPITP